MENEAAAFEAAKSNGKDPNASLGSLTPSPTELTAAEVGDSKSLGVWTPAEMAQLANRLQEKDRRITLEDVVVMLARFPNPQATATSEIQQWMAELFLSDLKKPE